MSTNAHSPSEVGRCGHPILGRAYILLKIPVASIQDSTPIILKWMLILQHEIREGVSSAEDFSFADLIVLRKLGVGVFAVIRLYSNVIGYNGFCIVALLGEDTWSLLSGNDVYSLAMEAGATLFIHLLMWNPSQVASELGSYTGRAEQFLARFGNMELPIEKRLGNFFYEVYFQGQPICKPALHPDHNRYFFEKPASTRTRPWEL